MYKIRGKVISVYFLNNDYFFILTDLTNHKIRITNKSLLSNKYLLDRISNSFKHWKLWL